MNKNKNVLNTDNPAQEEMITLTGKTPLGVMFTPWNGEIPIGSITNSVPLPGYPTEIYIS